jgi:hypothetical protein
MAKHQFIARQMREKDTLTSRDWCINHPRAGIMNAIRDRSGHIDIECC